MSSSRPHLQNPHPAAPGAVSGRSGPLNHGVTVRRPIGLVIIITPPPTTNPAVHLAVPTKTARPEGVWVNRRRRTTTPRLVRLPLPRSISGQGARLMVFTVSSYPVGAQPGPVWPCPRDPGWPSSWARSTGVLGELPCWHRAGERLKAQGGRTEGTRMAKALELPT